MIAYLAVAAQTALVVIVGVILNSGEITAIIAGVFLIANSFLTLYLSHRWERNGSQTRSDGGKPRANHSDAGSS